MAHKLAYTKNGVDYKMPLNELKVKSAKAQDKRYQMSDADGLYLEVMTSGKK
jgi:hypothetical protein